MKRVAEVYKVGDPDGLDAGSMAASLEGAQAAHNAALQRAGLPASGSGDAGGVAGGLRAGRLPEQR